MAAPVTECMVVFFGSKVATVGENLPAWASRPLIIDDGVAELSSVRVIYVSD